MRILYIHQHFSTPKGNAGTRSYEFAKKLISAGHKVTILCGSHQTGEIGFENSKTENGIKTGEVEGIKVIQIMLPYSNKMSFYKRLMIFLSFAFKSAYQVLKLDYDIIYATSTPLTVGFPALVAKFFRFKPYIFEVRDLWPKLPIEMGIIKNPLAKIGLEFFECLVYRFASNCIALSPGIRAGIIAKRPALKDRVPVIPNGCDLDLFTPVNKKDLESVYPELFENKDVSNDDFFCVFSGTHGMANGLESLIEVGCLLKKQDINHIKLILIGEGGQKESLVLRAKELKLSNLIFMSGLPKDRLAKILPNFDLGLQILKNIPAFYYGTSPNKFFDYIASGLPVLTNYPGWLADIISENNLGFCIKPDDYLGFSEKLIEISSLSELKLKEMAENSRKLAEKSFSRDKLGNDLLKLFKYVE